MLENTTSSRLADSEHDRGRFIEVDLVLPDPSASAVKACELAHISTDRIPLNGSDDVLVTLPAVVRTSYTTSRSRMDYQT